MQAYIMCLLYKHFMLIRFTSFYRWMPNLRWMKEVITWVVPPPSKSHHQDYYIFSRESQPKPSFPLLLGGGTTQVITEWLIYHVAPSTPPRLDPCRPSAVLQDGAAGAAPEAPAVTTTTTALSAPVQEVQYTNKRFLEKTRHVQVTGVN